MVKVVLVAPAGNVTVCGALHVSGGTTQAPPLHALPSPHSAFVVQPRHAPAPQMGAAALVQSAFERQETQVRSVA